MIQTIIPNLSRNLSTRNSGVARRTSLKHRRSNCPTLVASSHEREKKLIRCVSTIINTTNQDDIPKRKRNSYNNQQRRNELDITVSNYSDKKTAVSTSKLSNAIKLAVRNIKSNESSNETLSKCMDIMSTLLIRREDFKNTPIINWLNYTSPINENPASNMYKVNQHELEPMILHLKNNLHIYKKQYDLFMDTSKLIKEIKLSIQTGRIKASSGKEIRDLAALLGNALIICSESTPYRIMKEYYFMDDENDGIRNNIDGSGDAQTSSFSSTLASNPTLSEPSPSQISLDILQILQDLNLDIQPINYTCTIKALCQDGNWKDSSSLFLRQINIDSEGYVPLDSHLGWDGPVEMGLFAIAKLHQEKNNISSLNIVEKVFDAVSDLCLVSSQDQEKYILAAGAALGRAKQWQGLLDYIRTNEQSPKLGQPLIAAAMMACLENQQYDEVLNLYKTVQDDALVGDIEWQWSGRFDSIHPLCEDLALRAMGQISGWSRDAHNLISKIIKREGKVSTNGFLGAVQACERDSNYEASIDLWNLFMDFWSDSQPRFSLTYGDTANFITNGDNSEQLYRNQSSGLISGKLSAWKEIQGDVLTSVITTCNLAGEYGLALVCFHSGNWLDEMTFDQSIQNDDMITNLLHSRALLQQNENLMIALMTSLNGLGCQKEALTLFSHIVDQADWRSSNTTSFIVDSLEDKSNHQWVEAQKQIDNVLNCLQKIKQQTYISEEQRFQMSLGLARMINCILETDQHVSALHLTKLAFSTMSRKKSQRPNNSVTDTVKSFFGVNSNDSEVVFDRVVVDDNLFEDSHSYRNFLSESDPMLCASMKLLLKTRNADDALSLFFHRWENDASMRFSIEGGGDHSMKDGNAASSYGWVDSTNMALSILIRNGNLEDAISFFKAMNKNIKTPETYVIMANGYLENNQSENVSAMYIMAMAKGCLSEELGIIAMKSIVQQELQGKIRIIRSIADEVAEITGMKSIEWIDKRYWKLKRELGFHYARLLMYWRDPSTTQVEELRLALRHFQNSKKAGSLVENDVLRCIVQLASFEFKGLQMSPQTDIDTDVKMKARHDATEMITLAVIESYVSGLIHDKKFIYDAISGLRTVGANRQCVETILECINRGIEVPKRCLMMAKDASEEENDLQSESIIEDILSRS